MPIDRFYIGNYNPESGLQTNLKPFAIPDTAFAALNNAYVFRGRVRKRFGTRWFGNTMQSSRLRVQVDTSDGGGSSSGIVPGASGSVGQMFSIGDELFTVQALGTPTIMLTTGGASTHTFNTTTGAFVFTGVAATTNVYWYPALPVMGLLSFENAAINNEPTIAFDTRYAYEYISGSGWTRIAGEAVAGDATWAGDDAQFFWGATYTGVNAFDYIFFVTNFNELEPRKMRYMTAANVWNMFQPQLSAVGPLYLNAARIIIPFKNRLLVFNTWEGDQAPGTQNHYPFRMRYCAIGDPLATNAWRQDIPGNGGGLDCPTKEAIVTVQFVKDRLIVFCEESTWEIVYTGNQVSPFAWQQINSELGAESTFSVVPFDKVAIGVGNVGIVACTGANVDRIDDRIPDEVFKIHNTDSGPERVYGIRDYDTEMLYWSFPDQDQSAVFPFPNKVLIYNYKNGCWAFNNDSFTVFGYFQPQTGINWNSTTVTWNDSITWDSGVAIALFRNVVSGNQEGFTFIVDADESENALSLQITNMTVISFNTVQLVIINHNLRIGDYIYFSGIVSDLNLNLFNDKIFQVATVIDANTITVVYFDTLNPPSTIDPASVYAGGGLLSRVSKIQVLTKQYNFYANKGRNAYVSKVDFLVDKTGTSEDQGGEIEVNYYVSTSQVDMLFNSSSITGTGSLLGTSNLETFAYATVPFEAESTQLWHPLYFQADGEFIQLNMQLNDAQMRSNAVRTSDFQLNAMIFYAQPSASRPQ